MCTESKRQVGMGEGELSCQSACLGVIARQYADSSEGQAGQ
jgi:hypothetical protein